MPRSKVAVALVTAVFISLAYVPAGAASRRGERMPAVVDLGRDGLTKALASGRLTEAEYALERARSLFHPAAVRARWGHVARPDPHLATAILRDLAVRTTALSGAARTDAASLLARPTDGAADPVGNGYTTAARNVCSANLCYHWVESTEDAPPLLDSNANTIPDWVETTQSVAEEVWAKQIIEFGYRAPKTDASSPDPGPTGQLDLYLTNLGDDGLYGYCTTDDPNLLDESYTSGDFSAYCVIDNNYAEFPMNTPMENLQVTIGHEFFHSVQFAYDAFEDLWLMEGTAVWIEDELFDSVDDNYQYLFSSALPYPGVPVDYSDEGFAYGAWLFWRFLSEHAAPSVASPSIIHDVWAAADASRGALNHYSLAATEVALAARGLEFTDVFAAFSAANVAPAEGYEEGVAYAATAGTPPFTTDTKLTPKAPAARRGLRLDHLTSAYAAFQPGRKLPNRTRLKIVVDLPKALRAPAVSVLVLRRSGAMESIEFSTDNSGRGSVIVDFRRRKVRRVVLVFANASTRTECGGGSAFSCSGAPLDDDVRFTFEARAVK